VRAHDAAGNQSGNSNTVTRTGQTGDQTAPTAPSNLAVATPTSGTVKLTWTASTDNVGVTSYVVYRNGAIDTSVSGSTLTYSESQPDTAAVTYYVVAKDAAGNQSQPSNTVTRTGTGGGTNLAVGRPITGTANTYIYVPTNANDNDLTTYFEGSSYPTQATVSLLGNATLSSVVVKLNPDASWGPRTQTIAVLGQPQSGGSFVTLAAAQSYAFSPSTGNSVTIPVSGQYQNIELSITSNSRAPGGQVAEFQISGTPAPNPDLTPTAISWTPASPIETDAISVSITVKNVGTASSVASSVNVYLGNTKVGTSSVPALAAGAQTVVATNIGTQTAGSYAVTAKVDESNTLVELNDSNNNLTGATNLVVQPVQSADLVGSTSWNPGNPSAGQSVAFTVQLKNQGNISTSSGSHGVTATIADSTGATVKTLTGSYTGALAAGASQNVSVGSWTAVNGKYTVTTVVAVDSAELSVKQTNNTSTTNLFVGQGANMPYDNYEAEAGTYGAGAILDGPNRTIGDLGGEASGREAVSLNTTGSFVQWTSRESSNTFVVRFSIPDSSGGGGITSTLDLYVNGNLVQPLSLTSHFAWLYGAETGPGNSPGAGGPRHIYDEASFVLPATYNAGSTFKLQKDSSNGSQYAIDFMQLEQATPVANPDSTHYVVPTGFDQASVQAALDKVRMDTTGTLTGVYLPAGQYPVTQKFTIYQRGVAVVGAGPWFTQFVVPVSMENTDAGWSLQSGASGSTFRGFAWFGNFDQRIDGPGHTWDLRDQSNITIDNVWIEHTVVGVWGAAGVSNSHFTNMRIRDTYADGINLSNHSTGNVISNDEARATGDDSFALFAANDQEGGNNENNTIQNVTALFPWRAGGRRGDLRRRQQHDFELLRRRHPHLLGPDDQFAELRLRVPGVHAPDDQLLELLAGSRRRPFLGRSGIRCDLGVQRHATVPGHQIHRCDDHQPDVLRHHVPDGLLIAFDTALPGDRHHLHQHDDHRCAAQWRRVRREVRLRHLGEPVARSGAGSGGRFGHVQRPDRKQQLYRYRKHDLDIHHHRALNGRHDSDIGRRREVTLPAASPSIFGYGALCQLRPV
jgi:hypothetical protein